MEEVKKNGNGWNVKTNNKKEFEVASIVIAGGVGSFEPRKFSTKDSEKFEGKNLFYSVKDKSKFNSSI